MGSRGQCTPWHLAHPCRGSGARPGAGVVRGVGAVTRLPQPFLFLTAAVSLVAAARQATPAQAAQPDSPHTLGADRERSVRAGVP